MDDQSLVNVLAVLRLIGREQPNAGVANIISKLGEGRPIQGAALLRVSAYIVEEIDKAKAVIDNSNLVEEAKSGVRSALSALEQTFSLGNINGNIAQIHGRIPGFISNFVILLSASGAAIEQAEPEEALDLAKEIDEIAAKFNDEQIDPVIRDISRRHLSTLSTLLRHIPIFGLEPALSVYFDLMMRLRRADSKTTEQAKGKLDPLFATIKTWGERFGVIDKAVNAGAKLLERAEGAGNLLEYLPDI